MGSSQRAGTTADGANVAGPAPDAARTRSLLRFGVVAGPLYITTGLIQAFVRDGFDLTRHPLSVLANGPGGWVQAANFAVGGLMVIAAAAGFARVLHPTSRATSRFLGGFGVSMIIAAVFPADPVDGFPIGTPEGFPTSISTPGLIHFVAGALGFTLLGISCLVAARAMSRRHMPSLARLSLFSGLAVLLGFFGGPALPTASAMVAGIWFSVIAGWLWLAVMSLRLARETSSPPPHRTPAPGHLPR